jgi:hypothetical protein
MYTRRKFLATGVGAIVLGGNVAKAASTCVPAGTYEHCVSQVNFSSFAAAYRPQMLDCWCWAACISNVFSYYNHPVSQQRIVTELYGAPFDLPAMNTSNITRSIVRPWVDDNGASFEPRITSLYDAMNHIYGMQNEDIVSALDADKPVFVCARTHMMVLTAMEYNRAPGYPVQVTAVGVFDPEPYIGTRYLQADEVRPHELGGSLFYVAVPEIS